MSDLEKILVLRERLEEIERRPVTVDNRPMLEIARETLLSELSELGRRLSRRNYWRTRRAS